MANAEHLAMLRQGVEVWNAWRGKHPDVLPDLSGADLDEMHLRWANLSQANLSEAILFNADLVEANLSQANLIRANLVKANLDGTNLVGADLSGADLSGADISGTRLGGANLSQANLFQATLSQAYLFETNLSEVNLRESILTGTTFVRIDLSTVIGLDKVRHVGPSEIGIGTLYLSHGNIPEAFLRGCGVPEPHIEYLPALIGAMQPIQFYSCFISYSSQDETFARRLHERMRAEHLRVWFAPEDMKGGEKLHEQIERAIQMHDRLLLVLSAQSLHSEWVQQELRRARRAEIQSQRRKLFPIRLIDFEALQEWECMDSRTGSDLAEEVRQYFIPDFSDWKDHDAFEAAFARLLRDLKALDAPPAPPSVPLPPPSKASVLSGEEIAQQQRYLAAHRGTLASYIERLALLGTAHAPPEISHGIKEARANIARVKAILRANGADVTEHPDDSE